MNIIFIIKYDLKRILFLFSGYGKGYNMLQKEESGLSYLPEEIKNVDFFNKE